MEASERIYNRTALSLESNGTVFSPSMYCGVPGARSQRTTQGIIELANLNSNLTKKKGVNCPLFKVILITFRLFRIHL